MTRKEVYFEDATVDGLFDKYNPFVLSLKEEALVEISGDEIVDARGNITGWFMKVVYEIDES